MYQIFFLHSCDPGQCSVFVHYLVDLQTEVCTVCNLDHIASLLDWSSDYVMLELKMELSKCVASGSVKLLRLVFFLFPSLMFFTHYFILSKKKNNREVLKLHTHKMIYTLICNKYSDKVFALYFIHFISNSYKTITFQNTIKMSILFRLH